MPRHSGSFQKVTGLSKAAIKHGGRSGRRTNILLAGKQIERQARADARRRAVIQELSEMDRHVVQTMDLDDGTIDPDLSFVYDTVAPGDEGFGVSHEGGEFEVYGELAQEIAKLRGYQVHDDRNRRDRIEKQNVAWTLQIERLVDAYLDYTMHNDGKDPPSSLLHAEDQCGAPLAPVELVDVFSRRLAPITTLTTDIYANESLLHYGFLGLCPLHPSVAISLRTLSNFRQTHRTCPRFSIEAQCKTLCHLHHIAYRPYLAEQFTDVYDVYLEILRRVKQKMDVALGYDTPNYRLLNACPACFYVLADEPKLKFSFFCSFNGNNSQKRMGAVIHNTTARFDSRSLRTDRWLEPEEVNRFKDEVKRKSSGNPDVEDDWEDFDGPIAECVQRWRNAGPEQRKKMFSLFDESGIFITSCRHRFVLLICDMIRSRELAKYPLAMVSRLLDVYGEDIGGAYDVGCAFETTLRNSCLGPRAQQLRLQLMVGAFHGHAHHRGCQVRWHPLYVEGTGHFDGEGCEHIFSSSNDQARTTRHATRFHRRQALIEHFDHWDQDKYAALGTFLRKHYREALKAVFTLETELNAIKREIQLTDLDFVQFLEDERTYLEGLKQVPARETLKIKYVQSLNQLAEYQREWNQARCAANEALTSAASPNIHAILLQARHRVDAAYAKLQNSETYVFTLESQLAIEKRWDAESPDYQRYRADLLLQDYRTALDELERLVVQRLFELSKLGMSGTGYKLRQQIGKALQRRSEAIRNALSRYNTQAAKLTPPQPTLTWKEIADYSFLGEFELLRQSRTDVRQARWTLPSHREATVKYFKLCRAREEIVRLNLEIRRLRTKIHDDTCHVEQVLKELAVSNPTLHAALQRWWFMHVSVNSRLIWKLDRIERLPGFTGIQGIGVRVGSKRPEGREIVEHNGEASGPSEMDDAVEQDEQEEYARDIEKMTDFMERIALAD